MKQIVLTFYSILATTLVIILCIYYANQNDMVYKQEVQTNNCDKEKETEQELTSNKKDGKYENIIIYINTQDLIKIISERVGLEEDSFILKQTNYYSESEYSLKYTFNKQEGCDYIYYLLNAKTGNIYEDISHIYIANIFYNNNVKIIEKDKAGELLLDQIIKEIPEGYKIKSYGGDQGDYIFRITKKVNGKYEDLQTYRVNLINGAVFDYNTDKYLGLLDYNNS